MRDPTAYLEVVIALGFIGLLGWVAFYLYFRKHPEEFRGLNAIVAIVVFGPLLPLVQSSLGKRNYEISNRELWGIAIVTALFVTAVAVSLRY